MSATPEVPRAATSPPGRAGTTVLDVRRRLRETILAGAYAPGAPLPAQAIAREFGVSRTPLREALRMLQEEGLVVVESNQRARVIEWSPDQLEAVFGQRLMLAALCTRLTVPTLTAGDLERMRDLEAQMAAAIVDGDGEAWQRADVAFHECHFAGAPACLLVDLRRLHERALMFRILWLRDHRFSFSIAQDDHAEILRACEARDGDQAAAAAASHLAKVALTLMARLVPEREPSLVRQALRMAAKTPAMPEPAASGAREASA